MPPYEALTRGTLSSPVPNAPLKPLHRAPPVGPYQMPPENLTKGISSRPVPNANVSWSIYTEHPKWARSKCPLKPIHRAPQVGPYQMPHEAHKQGNPSRPLPNATWSQINRATPVRSYQMPPESYTQGTTSRPTLNAPLKPINRTPSFRPYQMPPPWSPYTGHHK